MAAGKEIKRLRMAAHVSAEKAAKLMNINADRLRKWEQRDVDPADSADIEAVQKYFGCSLEELGQMSEFSFPQAQKPYREQLREKKLSLLKGAYEEHLGIPVYDVPIDASFLERYQEDIFTPLYYLNIPRLRNCNFGAIVSGNSMWPVLKSGTVAVCRIITDFNYFDAGEMYCISTTNGFETVKYVQPTDDPEVLELIPHNESIKRSTIHKSMIIRMCIVEAWLNFR